ncbi:MAG: hypothetical protein ACTSQB_06565, partial [Candidatus Heimdallarchaeota archaeon]
DIQGRILTNEVTLGDDGRPILATVSIVVAVLVFVALMSGGIFVTTKQMRKNHPEEFPSELDLPEITDNNDSDFASNTNGQTVPDELAIEESASDEFPLLEDRRKQPPNVTIAEADLQEITEELLDKELDAIEIEPEPKLDEVKEYIAKVKEVGLMPGSNDGNGGVIKSIDDLATLGIEIDHRLLPEKERLRKLAEKELHEPISAPTLKEIAEEIEQTFVDK